MTQTIGNWREITQEAAERQEAKKKHRYRVRKYSLLHITGALMKAFITAAALCVIVGAAGNAIEWIARGGHF